MTAEDDFIVRPEDCAKDKADNAEGRQGNEGEYVIKQLVRRGADKGSGSTKHTGGRADNQADKPLPKGPSPTENQGRDKQSNRR